MSNTSNTKTIRIKYDVSNSGVGQVNAQLASIASGGAQAHSSLNQLPTSLNAVAGAGANAGRSLNAANNNIASMGSNAGRAVAGVGNLQGSLRSLSGVAAVIPGLFAAITVTRVAGWFIQASDAAALMDAKLKLAVAGWGDYNTAQADVARVAQLTRGEITSTAVLYGKLAQTGSTLNASQTQVARATETVTKALKVSGAGAAETEAAVLQLGQALGSGKLGGDEFSSLMESSPRLMKLFAESINQPVGALKQLATNGKLTSDVLFKALTDPKFTAKLDEEARQLPKTFGDAFTAVKNLAVVTAGAFDEGSAINQSVFNFADRGSSSMKAIADAARNAGFDVRDSFAGLSDVFAPFAEGASSVFDMLGIKVQSLQDQIASLLSTIDSVRNIPIDVNNAAYKFDQQLPAFMRMTSGPGSAMVERSNLAGDFRKGAAQSRYDRARSNVVGMIKDRSMKDFDDKGMSDEQLIAKLNATPARRLSGGTGNLRTPTASGDNDAAKKAAKEAENRAKRENDFWTALKGELETSKLFGIEAAKLTKERDLQTILTRNLAATEKTRVDTAIQELAQNRAITGLKQSAIENETRLMLLHQRSATLTEEQASIQDTLDQKRIADAMTGADINSADYRVQLDRYKLTLDQLAAEEKITKARREALDVGQNLRNAASAGSITAQAQLDRRDATSARDLALKSLGNTGLSTEAQRQASKEIADDFEMKMRRANSLVSDHFADDMISVFDGLANLFGSKFGKVFTSIADTIDNTNATANGSNGLIRGFSMISKSLGEGFEKGAKSMELTPENLKKGLSDLKNPFGSLKEAFGPNGSATKGIGQALGGAMQGYQIGSSIGDLGKALGIKGFDKGAKIGGTVGGLTGNPIIAAGASVVGGAISSLLSKTKSGAATITGGDAGGISLSGNSGKLKAVAGDLAGSVQTGLANIAKQLGGSVGSFGGITIGQRDKDFRVNLNGSSLKTKKGAVDFNGDSGAAVEFAIEQAIKRGAIAGLSDLAQKALNALDVDSAISFVSNWKSVMADFDAMMNPVTAGVNAIIEPLKTLRETMVSVGASTEDLTKLDQYRTMKLKEALDDQLSSLNDFRKSLNGDAGGVSKLNQLTDAMKEFDGYKAKIAAGDSSIDQIKFTALGQNILGLSGSLYGTATSEFNSVRQSLISATEGFASNVTNAFGAASGDTTVTAINTQTDAVVAQLTVQTDLARQNLEATERLIALMSGGVGGGGSSRNGQPGIQLV